MKTMKVRIHFFEDVLATRPNDDATYETWIASKAPDAKTMEEEIAAKGPADVFEKGITVFPRTKTGLPFHWNYQWKGFMKEKCSFLRKNDTTEEGTKPLSAGIKAFKKEIDGNIFIEPRKIVINTEDPIEINQRPLRTSGPSGERVALSASEAIHCGAVTEFRVQCHIDKYVDVVDEWLDYGKLHGTGQWRNSGLGRFLWELLDDDGNQIGGNYTPELFQQLYDEANL